MASAPPFDCNREAEVRISKKCTAMLANLALLGCVAHAESAQRSPAVEELEKAKARAERAAERDRCYENVEVVRALVEVANEQFTAGDADEAQKTVKETVTYSDRAKEAAQRSGHKLKQSEITLRKAQRRLDDLRHTLAFEDRGPVEAALKQIEADRQEILRQVMLH